MVLPSPVAAATCKLPDLPVRVQARLVELSCYGAKVEAGCGAWALGDDMAGVMPDPAEVAAPAGAPSQGLWEHRDVDIPMPTSLLDDAHSVGLQGAVVAHFDGGCRHKLGVGGYLAWAPDGTCLGGRCEYYGSAAPTNNIAEVRAMLDLLTWLEAEGHHKRASRVVVRGDSQLVIAFLRKVYRPGRRELETNVKAALDKVYSWRGTKVQFLHVPRE